MSWTREQALPLTGALVFIVLATMFHLLRPSPAAQTSTRQNATSESIIPEEVRQRRQSLQPVSLDPKNAPQPRVINSAPLRKDTAPAPDPEYREYDFPEKSVILLQ